MPGDPLRDIISSVRARLQDELEGQLRTLEERHDETLAAARQQIETESEQRWSGLLASARAEAQEEVAAAVSAAREQLEREKEAEIARVRAEAEQRLTEQIAAARRDAEQALANERRLSESRLEAERQRAAAEAEQAREEAERQIGGSVPAMDPATLRAVREIAHAQSLSDTLTALLRVAGERWGEASVYVANGARMERWGTGDSASSGSSVAAAAPQQMLTEAAARREAVRQADAVAVPLILGGVPVAVLQVRAVAVPDPAWMDSVEALARHTAAHLACVVTRRTAEATHQSAGAPDPRPRPVAGPVPVPAVEDDEASARRFARLLVSEIKLYNEGAVEAGREHGDLMRRLGPEIERAQRLYEERVSPRVQNRTEHFHHELIQTLAGGDAALLG